MQHIDRVATPSLPDVSFSVSETPYHTPHSALPALHGLSPVDTRISPAGTFLSIPSGLGSPYAQVSPPVMPSPSLNQGFSHPYTPMSSYYYPNQLASPMVASPSSYYTSFSQLNSPAVPSTSGFTSMSQNSSPTVPLRPYYESPARAPLQYVESPKKATKEIAGPKRVRLPQSVEFHPGKAASGESFTSRGAPGVRARDVLKGDAVLDGADDRVLEDLGVRQIHIWIDVSPPPGPPSTALRTPRTDWRGSAVAGLPGFREVHPRAE